MGLIKKSPDIPVLAVPGSLPGRVFHQCTYPTRSVFPAQHLNPEILVTGVNLSDPEGSWITILSGSKTLPSVSCLEMTALIILQELPSGSLDRQCRYSLSVHNTELITRTQKSSPREHPLVSIRVNHRERKLNVSGGWPNWGIMAINLLLTGETGRFIQISIDHQEYQYSW